MLLISVGSSLKNKHMVDHVGALSKQVQNRYPG